nr:TrfB-related DNA-binding protein [Achromobacter sp. DH1f]
MTLEFPPPLSLKQFAALADIARLDSASTRNAIRQIVVHGAARLSVAAELGVGKATISNAVGRLRSALSTAQAAIPDLSEAHGRATSQVDALCQIARLRPQEELAARAVVLDGLTLAQAAARADCSCATARASVARLLMGIDLAHQAVGGAESSRPSYAWSAHLHEQLGHIPYPF